MFVRRLVTLLAVTVGCYARMALGSLGRPAARRLARRRRWLERWGRRTAAAVGMEIEVLGAPPEPPFLLVANHVSWVDVFLLAATVPRCVFVAKSEIAGWPVLGRIVRGVGTVFTDRVAVRDLVRAGAAVGEALGRGDGVVLFPESTTGPGDDLLPFRPALLEVAIRTGCPVHWAVVRYGDDASRGSGSVAWWGGEGLLHHARRLLSRPGFTARVRFGGEPVEAPDRKVLARRLYLAMRGSLVSAAPTSPSSSTPRPPS